MVRSAKDKILMGTYSPKKLKVPLYPMPHVIAPGAVSTVPFTLVGQDDNTGKAVFLIGRIDYIDEFQIPHWLRFCFYVTNINGELGNCQEGNDEDRNPEIEPTKKKIIEGFQPVLPMLPRLTQMSQVICCPSSSKANLASPQQVRDQAP